MKTEYDSGGYGDSGNNGLGVTKDRSWYLVSFRSKGRRGGLEATQTAPPRAPVAIAGHFQNSEFYWLNHEAVRRQITDAEGFGYTAREIRGFLPPDILRFA